MFVNEVDNDQASEAFDVALSYIKKNPNLGVSVEVIQAQGNRTDSKLFLDASKKCKKISYTSPLELKLFKRFMLFVQFVQSTTML